MYSGRESLKASGICFLWVICPSCHSSISVESVKEAQSTNPEVAWPHPFFTDHQTPDGKGIPALMLAL